MKFVIGSDHRGYKLKEELKKRFEKENIKYIDVGANSADIEDFPKFAFLVAEKLQEKKDYFGITICGSGGGMVIASNKVKGARAVMCFTKKDVIRARGHDDCNILVLASEKTSVKKAFKMVKAMNSEFLKGRYSKRLQLILEYENKDN